MDRLAHFWALRSQISYALYLADNLPLLLDAQEQGTLADPTAIRHEVDRIRGTLRSVLSEADPEAGR